MRTRGAAAVAVVGAIVLLVGGPVGYRKVAGHLEQRDTCRRVAANVKEAPKHLSGGGEQVFLVGDSYSTGYTLPKATDGYAFLLAEAEGWEATVAAWPGAGFTSEGACGGHGLFIREVAEAPAGVDLVIVQGGLNDTGHLDRLPGAAADTVESAKAHAKRVVVVGPPVVPALPEEKIKRVDEILHQAATAQGAKYVSLLSLHLATSDDGVHPTTAGADMLAQYVRSQL